MIDQRYREASGIAVAACFLAGSFFFALLLPKSDWMIIPMIIFGFIGTVGLITELSRPPKPKP